MIKVTREYLAKIIHRLEKTATSITDKQLVAEGIKLINEYDKKVEAKEIGPDYTQLKLF